MQHLLGTVQSLVAKLEDCPLTQHRVLIATNDTYLFTAAIFASWLKGLLPITPNGLRAEALQAVSDCAWIITDEQTVVDFFASQEKHLVFYQRTLVSSTNNSTEVLAKLVNIADDSAFFAIGQMTSGSTGKPKLIVRKMKDLVLEAQILSHAISQQVPVSSQFLAVATVPLFHAYGLAFRFMLPLLQGMRNYALMFTYEEQLQILHRMKQTAQSVYLVSSPGFLKRLASIKLHNLVQVVLSAGGAISPEEINNVHTYLGDKLFEIFGSTETGVMAYRFVETLQTAWCLPEHSTCYIRPLAQNHEDTITLQRSGMGTLAISSPYLDASLMTKCQLTDASTVQVFLSDDVIELATDNTLRLYGRKGRILKIEDNRVSLDEVEHSLEQHAWVQECAVVFKSIGHRECIVAMIVLTTAGQQELTTLGKGRFIIQLRVALQKTMLPISVPRSFIITEAIPKTPTHKIAYQEVARRFDHALSED